MKQHKVWLKMDPIFFDEHGTIFDREFDPVPPPGKWWFWDETWAYKHGPFETEVEARNTLADYIRYEL